MAASDSVMRTLDSLVADTKTLTVETSDSGVSNVTVLDQTIADAFELKSAAVHWYNDGSSGICFIV